MENYFETKRKPLCMRIIAALTAFIAGLSIMGNYSFAAYAEDDIIEDNAVQTELDDDTAEFCLDEPEYIIDNNTEVTAKFTPLSEEELANIEALRFESLKAATVKEAESTNEDGFIYSEEHAKEQARSSLKNFFYRYTFAVPEPYEGDTSNYIERSDSFVAKSVITINLEHVIEPGHIEFRVPMKLFQYRNGDYCRIDEISVPQFKKIPRKDSDGVYLAEDIENYYLKSEKSAYNYYIDTDTDELVFVNYAKLNSGSSDIQLGYEKVDIFNVIDGTEWSVTPTATIVAEEKKDGNLRYGGEIVGQSVGRDYFTECDFTENGTTSKIYMLGALDDNSNNMCVLYCDINGTPVFIKVINNDDPSVINWYDLRGKNCTISDRFEDMRDDAPVISEPDIEISYVRFTVEKEVPTPLEGKVDSTVTLDSLTKSPEPNKSSGYGSQLYSVGQMKKYISVDNLPSDVLLGSKLSSGYIYTCWRVYTKGECTQPWSMLLEETPKAAKYKKDGSGNVIVEDGVPQVITDVNGNTVYEPVSGAKVLGVSTMLPNSYNKRTDHKVSESSSDDIRRLKNYVDTNWTGKDDYWYVADANTEMRGTFGLQNVIKDHEYSTGYYVVVAYPVSELDSYENDDIIQYPPLQNQVTAHLYDRDSSTEITDTAQSSGDIIYKKFEWTGGEEYWHTYKRVEGECKDGLLSVYDKLAGENGENDYIGDIMFHESYRGGAYSTCHNLVNYEHIDGKYYKVVNTDDVLTAQPYGEIKDSVNGRLKRVYGKPQVLDGSDYFYSKAVLTLSEFEVDPFEDEIYPLTSSDIEEEILKGSDKIDRDWVVYGWYEGGSRWIEIDLRQFGYPHKHFTLKDYYDLRKSNGLAYLTLNFMDKGLDCPFRLKVEHNCLGYSVRLNLDLETQLKTNSTKLRKTSDLRENNTFYDENGNAYSGSDDFETFRISLRNYSATKATKYTASLDGSGNLVETPEGELITNYNNASGKYYNIEGWAERTLVNANRYLFLDGDLFFDDNTHVHCQRDNMPKSELGRKILLKDPNGNENDPENGQLESPYGVSEYLPLKYINGDQTFNTLEEFIAVNSHVYRDHAAIDISLLEKDARADKFAAWENDTQNGQVIMTYTLSGYEGYKLSKELRPIVQTYSSDLLSGESIPTREKVVLCDLLPKGVNYYGYEMPIAGKLTTTQVGDPEAESITNDDVDTYVDTWDKSMAKVVGIDVANNWEETGRTLVSFTVEFNDINAVMTDNNWFIGCGVRFKAYVAWDNYDSAREKDNIFVYAVHMEDTHYEGNIFGRYTGVAESQVYDGAGTIIPATSSMANNIDYSPFKGKTLENTLADKNNRMYGHANEMEIVTMARTLGITKKVKADANKYTDYGDMTSVIQKNDYTYKIRVEKTSNGTVQDVVIFDQIEKISWEHFGNFGTFKGVDISEIEKELTTKYDDYPKIGDKPNITIWYSKDRLAPTTLYELETYNAETQNNEKSNFIFRQSGNTDKERMKLAEDVYGDSIKRIPWSFEIVNGLIGTQCSSGTWDIYHEGPDNADDYKWIELPKGADLPAGVKSIAIDFGDYKFKDAFTFNAYVKMCAPNLDDVNDARFALNEASYFFNDTLDTDNYEYSKSEITIVSFGDDKRVSVKKDVIGEIPEEIDNDFEFQVISDISYTEGGNSNAKMEELDYSNIGYLLYKPFNASDHDHLVHTTNKDGGFSLKKFEKAVFEHLPDVNAQSGEGDYTRFRIIEKSSPYFLSVESAEADDSNQYVDITFTNYYRPVIYLTKKIKGVPEGVTPENDVFNYKIKIYDTQAADPDQPIAFSDDEGGYKLLSKETSGEKVRKIDTIRDDNKLYWYKVSESVGWYETPNGWKINENSKGLYNESGSGFNTEDNSFTVTFKAGETVAVPIYIQHKVDENDVGMLYKDANGDLKARYRIEIVEDGLENSEWYCSSSIKKGDLGTGENAYIWVNNYMYKELLVKKTVTNAPSEAVLRNTSFKFKLTDKNGAPYSEYKTEKPVKWKLCTMDKQGNITPLSGEGTSGEVLNDGTFEVKGCGNADDSTGDTYVIKLSYVRLDEGGKAAKYTVTEVDLSNDYSASKVRDTVDVKPNVVYTTANIENDYLKRDITINKIVAAQTMPGAGKKFTIVLCPQGVETLPDTLPSYSAVNKNGAPITVSVSKTETPAKGWAFGLSEGDSITFTDVGKVDEKFDIYEEYDSYYVPLTLTYLGGDHTEPYEIKLDSMSNSSFDVINGGEGYVVLRKQFKGDIGDIETELNNANITLKLELRKTDGTYIVPSDASASANITVSGTPVSSAENITFKRTDNVIINMNGLKGANDSVSLDGTFRVTETYDKKIQKDGNWYVVEPDKTDGVWEFSSDTKQGVIVNNVTEFKSENAIYKRIGLRDKSPITPTGNISFTISNAGVPVQGVKCNVAKVNVGKEELTDYSVTSDENGIINIDFSNEQIHNSGWVMNSGVMQYYLKLYFDSAVKINPSDPNTTLRITENTISTDKSWGAPAGYEKTNDDETYVNEAMLESGSLSQWTIKDADTFVNTQDTEKVSFTKKVNATGDVDPESESGARKYTDEDTGTLFRFVVSELIGSEYQPAPHISYKVYDEEGNLVREGVTDYDANDPNSGWGVFTLHHDEKAILELPKNAYWQVSEDNTGKYKLVTDADGNIVQNSDDVFDENDALYADSSSIGKYNAKYITHGFELHTTLDMLSTYPHGTDVVLINGMAGEKSPMFAYYNESQDANDPDGIYRTHIAEALYYYANDDSKYSDAEYNITNDVYFDYSRGSSGLIWSNAAGTASAYKTGATIEIPESVYFEEDGVIKYHHVVGIGKNAYNGDTSLKTVFIPKYVEKIGDRAFSGCTNLCDVLWYGYEKTQYYGKQLVSYPSTITDGVKVLGAYSFSNTSVDVIMPPTVVTMEAGVFKGYEGNKYGNSYKAWRNAPPEKGKDQNVTYLYRYGLNIPSTLRYFAPDDDDTPILDATLGGGSGEIAMWTGTIYPVLRIGSGESIPEMKTSFSYIGNNTSDNIGKKGYLALNAFYNTPMRWSTFIIGQNTETGVTILSDFSSQIYQYANLSWSGSVIVFPKGKLTLQEGCLMQRHSYAEPNCLRIFQTEFEDIDNLIIEGNQFWNDANNYSLPIYVFTNISKDQISGNSEWAAKINLLDVEKSDIKVYYKDDLDDIVDDNGESRTRVEKIIRDVSKSIGSSPDHVYWDDEIKELLYNAAGLPIPNPLPAPRHLAAPDNIIIQNNDIYLEKKRELLD